MAGVQYRKVAYGLSDSLLNVFPSPILANRAPATTDKAQIGQIWVYVANNAPYILTSIVNNSATWQLIEASGGAGVFSSLVVTPGPITMTGVTNINASGTAATNIGGGTYTGTVTIGNLVGAAVTLLSNAIDIDSTAGGTISVGPSVTTGSFSIANALTTGSISIGNTGSTSTATFKGDTVVIDSKAAGAIGLGASLTTGTMTLGNASMTGTLTLGNSTSGQTINIGNAAGANTINVGNTSGTATNIIGGTAISVAGANATTITIGATAQTGNMKFGDSSGTVAVDIGNGTGANAVNIGHAGTGAVTIGNTTGNVAISGNATITSGNLVLATAAQFVQLPGPIKIMSGAGAPANGLAAEAGDLYIRTDPAGATSRIYVATAANTWTNVTCAA